MRRAILVISGLMVVIGAVWILQGANLLAGSRMSGDPFWAQVGLIVLLLGCGLGTVAFLRR